MHRNVTLLLHARNQASDQRNQDSSWERPFTSRAWQELITLLILPVANETPLVRGTCQVYRETRSCIESNMIESREESDNVHVLLSGTLIERKSNRTRLTCTRHETSLARHATCLARKVIIYFLLIVDCEQSLFSSKIRGKDRFLENPWERPQNK